MPIALTTASLSPIFDPALHGTPDYRWQLALADAPKLPLPACPMIVVSPHPDDEVLGAGGLISSAARAGHDVTVVSVTDGEAAYPDWKGLDRIRRFEVSEALGGLAPRKASTVALSIPDGQVDRNRAKLFDAIDRLNVSNSVLVAPYERDGHPDHDATGEVCRDIAQLRGSLLWRYPIWAWHHSTPECFAHETWGRFHLDSMTLLAKGRAVQCFTSQLRPSGREPIVPSHVLPYFERSYEAFLL